MPGALFFGYKLMDIPRFCNQVMGANLCCGVTQSGQRLRSAAHPSIMYDEHAYRLAVAAITKIRGRCFDHPHPGLKLSNGAEQERFRPVRPGAMRRCQHRQ